MPSSPIILLLLLLQLRKIEITALEHHKACCRARGLTTATGFCHFARTGRGLLLPHGKLVPAAPAETGIPSQAAKRPSQLPKDHRVVTRCSVSTRGASTHFRLAQSIR